jgi:hypothetical protein
LSSSAYWTFHCIWQEKSHSQHLCKQQPKPKFTHVMFSNWNLQKPLLMFTTPPKCFKLLRLHSNLLNLPKTWSTWVLSSKNLWWHGWRNSCPTLWSQLLGAQHLMSLVLPPPAQSHPSTILLWGDNSISYLTLQYNPHNFKCTLKPLLKPRLYPNT